MFSREYFVTGVRLSQQLVQGYTSNHLLFKHSSIWSNKGVFIVTQVVVMTGCRRKEEARDIELADEYNGNAPGPAPDTHKLSRD